MDHKNDVITAPASLRDILRLRWRAWKYAHGRNGSEIRSMQRLLRPGETAVDAGAHKGAWTWWLHRQTGPAGRVAAFEPQADLAAALRCCGARLGWDNVAVNACALSSAPGEGSLVVPGPASPGAALAREPHPGACRVPLISLDAWFGAAGWPPPAFIKADCEGHEPEVLQGARKILAAARPALLLELEIRHLGEARFSGVLELLASLGYAGSFFRGGALQPLCSFRPALHQRQTPGAFWKAPGYCNNFLFEAR